MNTTLLLANAAALAILASFHFMPESATQKSVAQRMPHYLQVQRQPQLAVLTDKDSFAPRAVSAREQALPPQMINRLVF
ncbi:MULTISPECIES: hypothetical protein [Pseudomonas]|uniref:hypothetical protein n=1 Tax=Pseudomonas TaxID=286 RepID=UPI000FDDD190|nr:MULTISPECIES: hypothetical protein [Pseudomonas]AZZ77790.1 hypothetical protein CCX46_22500 [Pseudomonas sp. RU47]WNZ82957.1 hypothetical protein QOM10_22055 [Pseudomonas sp. P108]VVQ31230.1 hypothetical protein PS947_02263 [Pseudomonas fluorescens]